MQELIDKLKSEHGLSDEQSHGILATVTNFIKEKFPMLEGMVGNLFHHNPSADTTAADSAPADGSFSGSTTGDGTTADSTATADTTASSGGSFLDKISDIIPGATGEKVEEFAKDKLGGLFGDKKI